MWVKGDILWLQQTVSTNIYWMSVQRSIGNSDGKDKVQTCRNSNAGRHICHLLQRVAHAQCCPRVLHKAKEHLEGGGKKGRGM